MTRKELQDLLGQFPEIVQVQLVTQQGTSDFTVDMQELDAGGLILFHPTRPPE